MRQSTKLWIGAALLAASLSVVYVVTCDQKCRCALFPPKVPPPSDSVLYQIVRDTIEGKLRIDSIPYRSGEIILDTRHPGANSIKKYLKDNCYVKAKSCDCAEGLELWRYAGTGTDPIGVTDPPKPPPGVPIGGLCRNYIIDLPAPINPAIIPPFTMDIDNKFDSNPKTRCSANSIKVAITDSGIDTDNRNALYTKRIDMGWNFARLYPNCGNTSSQYGINMITPGSDPSDLTGHGTHVLGIFLGFAEGAGNTKGVGFQLINIKVLDEQGDLFHALCGLYTAMNQGAKVINVSWGFKAAEQNVPPILDSFIKEAANRGVMIVAGLGNDGINLDTAFVKFWPACFAQNHDNVISVGAVSKNDSLAAFSNRSFKGAMTIAALGVDVQSTYPMHLPKGSRGTGFAQQSGTSMATPFVARTVAVILGIDPKLSPTAIKEGILRNSKNRNGIKIHSHNQVIESLCH